MVILQALEIIYYHTKTATLCFILEIKKAENTQVANVNWVFDDKLLSFVHLKRNTSKNVPENINATVYLKMPLIY